MSPYKLDCNHSLDSNQCSNFSVYALSSIDGSLVPSASLLKRILLLDISESTKYPKSDITLRLIVVSYLEPNPLSYKEITSQLSLRCFYRFRC
ncbi:hypothetical protein [Flavobacterium sp. LB1P71]|uniref:hypothetical protein n=1 Tax=unclassified Flavobacterium TaxID=196869 RepID=UPI003AAAD280